MLSFQTQEKKLLVLFMKQGLLAIHRLRRKTKIYDSNQSNAGHEKAHKIISQMSDESKWFSSKKSKMNRSCSLFVLNCG